MRRGAAALLATLALSPATAFAQVTADPEALVREGVELRREGHDEAALERFGRAWELGHAPRARAQMGFAEQALGRWQLAEAHVLEARAASTDPWVRGHLDVIERSLATTAQHLATLTVSCGVVGAELLLDGHVAGALPLAEPLRVVAGEVSLEVRAPGHATVRRTLQLAAGATARESVDLAPVAPTPPASAPEPPPAPAPAPLATLTVATAAPPPIVPSRVEAQHASSAWRVLAAAGWALGGAGVTAGFVGLAVAEGRVSTFNGTGCTLYAESPPRASSDACVEIYRGAESARAGASAAFAAGAALAVGGTVIWLLRPRAPGAHAWGCAPTGGGLSCVVRF